MGSVLDIKGEGIFKLLAFDRFKKSFRFRKCIGFRKSVGIPVCADIKTSLSGGGIVLLEIFVLLTDVLAVACVYHHKAVTL